MKRIALLLLGVTLLMGSPVEIGIGARAQGMGGAFVGVADDASCVYWNPSGLASIEEPEIYFMHWMMPEIKELMIDYLSIVYPALYGEEQKFGFGFGWKRIGARLEEYSDGDLSGEAVTSTMSENTFSLGAGVLMSHSFSLGFVLNRFLLNSKIGSRAGWGFDFGMKLQPFRWLNLGLLARNVAAGYGDEKIDPSYRFGMALNLFPKAENGRVRHRVIMAFDLATKKDVNGTEGTTIHTYAGLEIHWFRPFALRVGWNDNYPFTAGLSIYIGNVALDYGYSSGNEYLKDSHRVSLSLKF